MLYFFFFSSRRRHTRSLRDWSSDVCSSDLWLAATADAPLLWAALEQLPAPWSGYLSGHVRVALATLARADPGPATGPRAIIRLAALRLEPPVAPQVGEREVADGLKAAWSDMLDM